MTCPKCSMAALARYFDVVIAVPLEVEVLSREVILDRETHVVGTSKGPITCLACHTRFSELEIQSSRT